MSLDLTTRENAVQIVQEVGSEDSFISHKLRKLAHDRRVNYPLLQKLVKGTIEWRSRIDHILDPILKGDSKLISPYGRAILQVAAYQLLLLEKTPHALVFKESLTLSKRELTPKEHKVIERVIRAIKELPPQLDKTPDLKDGAEIARYFGHPLWVIKIWIEDLGKEETIKLCEANNRPWPVSIRTNTLRTSTHQLRKYLMKERVGFIKSKYLDDCTLIEKLPRGIRLHELESFRRGLFQVQDESAALVGLLVDPRPGDLILDLCAAPGGKATHLATIMHNKGEVLALDSEAERLQMVRQNCRRLGVNIVKTRVGDARTIDIKRLADRVLLDAPCSGLGVLGRKSDIRWGKNEATITELTKLQAELIDHAASLVRPGGVLVYSTCTVLRQENEQIVEGFLIQHPNFQIAKPNIDRSLLSKDGFLRSWPHRHNIGGAFGAVLIREH